MDISLVLGIVNIFLILVIIGVILFLTYARIVLKKDMEKLQSTTSNTSTTASKTTSSNTSITAPTTSNTPTVNTTTTTAATAPKTTNTPIFPEKISKPMCCQNIDNPSVFYKNCFRSCVQGKFSCTGLVEPSCNIYKSSCNWTPDKGCTQKPDAIENYTKVVDMSVCDANPKNLNVSC